MDFESESVEDNEVNQDAIHFDDVSRIRTNGTSANDAHHSCAAQNAFDAMGSVSAAAEGKDLSGVAANSPPDIPSPLTKGYGLKKWKRIPRDFIKDMNSSEDTSKILKRALSASGNPIKPQLSPTETKQNNEGSVGSITPLRNIGNVDGLALHGSSSNSRFAMGSAFNHGTDSENSEDRSSKSSTAASAPKARYDLNAVLGHVREKNRIKSMNGKSTGGSGQKGNQGKGRVEGSKKARGGGERIKVEKENSQSSIESDSRSSCFVFRQGNVAGASASASNGNQNERSVTDDGDNSDGAYAGDQQFSEEVETAYRKEDEVEAEDVTQDNLTTNVSFDVKEEKDRNHWSPLNKDPMEESILSLQSAQHALEKEIKKLGEIGKDEIRSSSIFNDAEPSSFVFDNLETHKTSLSFQMGTGKAASSSFEVTVLGLTGKVKLLETELEETMAILKSKESRVAELESSINTRNSHKEEVRETDEEFERFFRQRIEAEIEYLAITRAIEKLQCETIIDGEKHVFADEQVEMMNRPKEAESKATTLKKQSCDDVSETKEVSTTRWEVFKVSSCAFVQLILLFLVLWLFVLQMPSPAGLDVPT
ncbi:WPP domain-interacting protein 2-like [Cucurbita pepo subsp. pepo]|uniref:WPP domain-interacting protein 2-like n=1 Tax=Cucurbita pepo subsp. pepo TaxID=3664 RepID=UPI000C9DA687|nr:WPP domain-interacting protein 2-like [Cucurbita pepo subsp. pepo]XP_023539995.1 WPP domain-interacting protein 2-like [Cucurbita pepo subsp. pepo]